MMVQFTLHTSAMKIREGGTDQARAVTSGRDET